MVFLVKMKIIILGIENGALFMVLPSDGRNVNNLNWYHGPIQWEKRSITNGDLQVLRQLQTNANTRQVYIFLTTKWFLSREL